MADITRAENRIDNILMRWYSDDTVLLGAWCLVERVPSKTQDTMGIDSSQKPPVIRYNPNFVNSVSLEQLETVMASEGLKLLLRHPTTRLKNPKQLSSVASSIEVNDVMNYFPGDEFVLKPNDFGIETGKYYEFYFRKLLENMKDAQEKIQQIWNSMSDDQKKDAVENAMSQAQSEAEADQQNRDEDGYKNMDNPSDAMKEYHNPDGTSNQDWSENNEVEASIKNYINKQKGADGWGKHTGKAKGSIVAAAKPKISWKEVLRRFHTSVVTGTSIASRKKVNRRYDLQYPGRRREYEAKIIMAIDISGSMSDEDIAEGVAVVNSICRHSHVDYLLFDTQIKDIVKNYRHAKKEININGRGGTDFQCVVDYVDKNKCDGLIIFSDMMAAKPSKPKNTKTLWLSHSKGQKPPVSWGMTAELNRYE